MIGPVIQTAGRSAPDREHPDSPALAVVTQLLKARAAGEAQFETTRDRMHLSRRQANQVLEAFWAGYALGMQAGKEQSAKSGGDPGGDPEAPADKA